LAILHQGRLRAVGAVKDLLGQYQMNLEQVFLHLVGCDRGKEGAVCG
jgi:hypothetical protein